MSATPKRELRILMGDFNAKVERVNEDIEHVMGRHNIRVMNKNDELPYELCGLKELRIDGTVISHKYCHKVPWVSPDSQTQN